MNRPSIILADDDNALLESVQKLVELEFRVVARANDGQQLLDAVREFVPDLIITDISMGGLSGIRATRQLKAEQPDRRIVFLTVHEEPVFLAEAMKAGALGYVVKRLAGSELLPALREVLQGRPFISSSLRS